MKFRPKDKRAHCVAAWFLIWEVPLHGSILLLLFPPNVFFFLFIWHIKMTFLMPLLELSQRIASKKEIGKCFPFKCHKMGGIPSIAADNARKWQTASKGFQLFTGCMQHLHTDQHKWSCQRHCFLCNYVFTYLQISLIITYMDICIWGEKYLVDFMPKISYSTFTSKNNPAVKSE